MGIKIKSNTSFVICFNTKWNYSFRPILPIANRNASITQMCLDTSTLAKSIMDGRTNQTGAHVTRTKRIFVGCCPELDLRKLFAFGPYYCALNCYLLAGFTKFPQITDRETRVLSISPLFSALIPLAAASVADPYRPAPASLALQNTDTAPPPPPPPIPSRGADHPLHHDELRPPKIPAGRRRLGLPQRGSSTTPSVVSQRRLPPATRLPPVPPPSARPLGLGRGDGRRLLRDERRHNWDPQRRCS
jgi:hypothetical protein